MLVKPVVKEEIGDKTVGAEKKELEQAAAPAEEIGTDELLRELKEVLEVRKDEPSKAEPTVEKKPAKLAPDKTAPADQQIGKTDASEKKTVMEQASAPKDKTAAEKAPVQNENAVPEKTTTPKGNAVPEKAPVPKGNAVPEKAPAGRVSRDEVDDDAFLAELHALIGDI